MDHGSDATRYEESPVRRYRWWIIAGGAILFAAIFAWRGVNSALPVRTATLESPSDSTAGAILNASGYVVARRLATVSSKVTGRVEEVLFEEGARVESGEVLARLDAETELARRRVAASSLEASRRGLRETEVRLADARRTLDRNRSLVERRLLAQSVLDTSQADVAALAARLAAAQAEVAVAEANLAVSEQALNDLVIRAPFAGVILSKDAQPGEMVSPISAGGGYTRTGIATIVDMSSREIEVDVNEAYINRVHAGQKVEAVLDAYPRWTIPAQVISIVPTADRQKATVRVRIGFDELDSRVLPDMGVKVGFLEDGAPREGDTWPLLPKAALVTESGSPSVWVVRDGKVELRQIETGAERDGFLPVLEGLQGGETVVLDPPGRLREGRAVELVDDRE
jgi:RND family efflux transporter MFP subunit